MKLLPGVLLLFLSQMLALAEPKKIVLIAGPLDDHPLGTHEYENNVLLLKYCLENSPVFKGARTEIHFNGWPENPATLDDADTIFLTSGGSDRKETDHPLYVGDRFAQLEKQMKRGCGLVLYHWSTFHPTRVHDQITEWVGGYFDYETGTGGPTKKWFSKIESHDWTATPASTEHPIRRGLKPFPLKEEFYFNIRFRENDPRLSPILLKDTAGDPKENIVAWAVARADGGRGFGFTGGHFYTNLWIPNFRKLVLNAVAWTAKIEVPDGGVESSLGSFAPPPSKKIKPQTGASAPTTNAPPAAKKIRPANPEKDSGKVAKEEAWKDSRWNQTEVGQFVSSIMPLTSGTISKGLSIRVGDNDEGAVCYNTATAAFRAAWTGKFLQFDSARFGLIKSPTIAGELQFVVSPTCTWIGVGPRYRGLFLNGKRVALSYEVNGTSVLELPWIESKGGTRVFTRTFELGPSQQEQTLGVLEAKDAQVKMLTGLQIASVEKDGKFIAAAVSGNAGGKLKVSGEQVLLTLPARSKTRSFKLFVWSGAANEQENFIQMVKRNSSLERVSTFTRPGRPRWTETLVTKGEVAPSSSEAYVVDTITVPYENPYKALMFLSGVDFFENGNAAVCTIHGDVWVVSGIDEKLNNISWKRFATGLFQPLGLKVVNDVVYVLGRDQITILHDRDKNGEADFYENFCNQIKTSEGGHDYVTCLEMDAQGNFYYVDPAGVHQISKDGLKHETIATGWRNPNGLGVSSEGVITVAPQEGHWTPSSAICEVKRGGFYGFSGPRITSERPLGYDAPLCWIPRMIDNSTGSQVWVTSDRWGPLKGQMLNLSYGRCDMMLVLREMVDGQSQGGVVVLKPRFLSGVMRGTFRKQDGQLYLVGSLGWSTGASRDGCLQRVRYTRKNVYLPVGLNVRTNGILLAFSETLDKETAEDTGSYGIEQWNYLYSADYGSKEYSVVAPEISGHDPMDVISAKLMADGHSVFLEIPNLRPVMQMQIQYNLNAADGKTIRGEIYNTINRVAKTSR